MPRSDLNEGLRGLTIYAQRDLDLLWRQVTTPDLTRAALNDLLPSLVNTYGSAAASVSADWYDNLRDSKDIRGHFRAIPADIKNPGTDALIGWATSTASDLPALKTLILGGTQRRIANFSRLTVTQSAVQDPGARGWYRVGDGNECEFCSMLLGRGAVYSEASADFQAHDHCGCSAEPDFG